MEPDVDSAGKYWFSCWSKPGKTGTGDGLPDEGAEDVVSGDVAQGVGEGFCGELF